ncbi:MAG TPA: DUF6476 family protein [Stellaceae bacterium]|nr:DUF6476 family protein [Stellaceae bacterium]
MRALKLLVVVMGVMILAGFVALFVAIAGRMSQPRTAPPPAAGAAASAIDLPAGARVETMSVASDRLAVEMVLPGGERQIVVIDLASGRLLRTVRLRPAP